MGVLKNFSLQFRKPEGMLGSIAGKLMSFGVEKNKWTISLLGLQPCDKVLEIGFGPGIAIELASKVIKDGTIVGVDFSTVMLRQAQKRNEKAIKNGRVQLVLANADHLPSFDVLFDKVFSVNSIIFWESPATTLTKIRQSMQPGGLIALTVQPFIKGATEETARQIGNKIANDTREAGFSNVRLELKPMKPVAAVCVLGVNGSPRT